MVVPAGSVPVYGVAIVWPSRLIICQVVFCGCVSVICWCSCWLNGFGYGWLIFCCVVIGSVSVYCPCWFVSVESAWLGFVAFTSIESSVVPYWFVIVPVSVACCVVVCVLLFCCGLVGFFAHAVLVSVLASVVVIVSSVVGWFVPIFFILFPSFVIGFFLLNSIFFFSVL